MNTLVRFATVFLLAFISSPQAAVRAPFEVVSRPLLNIDFGAHLNPGFPQGSGPLAIGKGSNDVWNLYSRDGATLNDYQANGTLTNLVWSDGTPVTGRLEVQNAAGAWATAGHHDPIFYSYLNPLGDDPDIRLEFSELPEGTYDLYIYAHAGIPESNSILDVATSAAFHGTKATSTAANWDDYFYTEGHHYVRFARVGVAEGETLNIVIRPGAHGRAYLNALQMVRVDEAVAPAPRDDRPARTDLFDVSRGTVVTAHSPLWPNYEIEAIFGASNPSLEPGSAVFENGPQDFAHFVEWRTPEPVLLEAFRLFAGGDGPEYLNQREFASFVLKARSPGSATYDQVLYTYTATHPYTLVNSETYLLIDAPVGPVTAQDFRAEFVQFTAGRGYDGPRIVELDGFGSMLTNRAVIASEPRSTETSAGGDAHFEVGVRGADPIFYQWFLNGATIASATNAVLAITNVQPRDAGTYTVRVWNSDGEARSKGAVLNVLSDLSSGRLHFANWVEGSVNAPVRDPQGSPLSGPGYLAQLYAGSSQATLLPVGAAVPFGFGERAGYFEAGVRFVPGVEPGAPALVEVRAWAASAGSTFEQAVAGGGARGRSRPVEILLGSEVEPAPNLLGLAEFSLIEPPRLVTPLPAAVTLPEGHTFALAIEATGGDLRYQWFFNDSPISNATQSTFQISPVAMTHAGVYAVEVRNDAGQVRSGTSTLTVREADHTPPVVTITSPAGGVTTALLVVIAGTASDDMAVSRVELLRNSQPIAILPLVNGQFTSANVLLQPGTNVFVVRASDTSGNFGVASITLVQQAARAVYSADLGDVPEGSRVRMPIFVRSEGDVSALTFTMLYPVNNLADPEWEWATEPAGALAQVNTNTAGQLRASFALPGGTLTGGTQLLANVYFRVRSAPGRLFVTNRMQLQGIYGASGNTLPARSDVFGGSLTVVPRRYVGDNNANDRLDVGDASTIMRLVTLLEGPRPWDVPKNDLNGNGELDAGDIIRVLRTVVGLDPQPGNPQGQLAALHAPGGAEALVLTADKVELAAGDTVKVALQLEGRSRPLSGASFRLKYPADALRMESAAAIRPGSLVPASAVTLWNLSPAQNDFARQDGVFHFAASSPSLWAATNGVLLELTFSVRDSIRTQARWAISAENSDLTDGWLVSPVAAARLSLPAAGVATLALARTNDQWLLRGLGQANARYRLESSPDLMSWGVSGGTLQANAAGEFQHTLDFAGHHQFFRAVRAD